MLLKYEFEVIDLLANSGFLLIPIILINCKTIRCVRCCVAIRMVIFHLPYQCNETSELSSAVKEHVEAI